MCTTIWKTCEPHVGMCYARHMRLALHQVTNKQTSLTALQQLCSIASVSCSSVQPSMDPFQRRSRGVHKSGRQMCTLLTLCHIAGVGWHPLVPSAAEYVPSPLDPSVAAAQVAVILFIATALPAAWWLIVVPTSRGKLAKDKRRGARFP